MVQTTKIWFVTGSSKGFGREFVEVALHRGDRVAATARNPETLGDLKEQYGDAVLPLALDVTDRAAVSSAVRAAHETFGRLDVVVNNAGYGHSGAVEELTEADIRAQMETNFFGLLWVTQEVLPILRAQGHGHIIQITSIGGIAAFPTLGAYHASKWAVEGLTEALAGEVAGFGINVTLVEPSGFSTDWSGASMIHSDPNPAYDGLREAMQRRRAGNKPGDPKAAGAAMLEIVDAEKPPLRVLFGASPTEMVKDIYARRLETWDEWSALSIRAQG